MLSFALISFIPCTPFENHLCVTQNPFSEREPFIKQKMILTATDNITQKLFSCLILTVLKMEIKSKSNKVISVLFIPIDFKVFLFKFSALFCLKIRTLNTLSLQHGMPQNPRFIGWVFYINCCDELQFLFAYNFFYSVLYHFCFYTLVGKNEWCEFCTFNFVFIDLVY